MCTAPQVDGDKDEGFKTRGFSKGQQFIGQK